MSEKDIFFCQKCNKFINDSEVNYILDNDNHECAKCPNCNDELEDHSCPDCGKSQDNCTCWNF